MPEIKLVCPSCGQSFQALDNQKKVFCVHCGMMIDRSAELEAARSADDSKPVKSDAEIQLEAAKAAFAEARFPIIDKKTGQKGDRLIGLWTMLIFHSHNSRSGWGLKTARKDIDGFFKEKRWQKAIELAGPYRTNLMVDQLLDSAVIFLTTCREDSKYGSKLLGVVRMSPDQIAEKAAEDICQSVIRFLFHIESPGETDAIIHAAVMAYPRVFSERRQVLSDTMAESLTVDERQRALTIVSTIAENTRSY